MRFAPLVLLGLLAAGCVTETESQALTGLVQAEDDVTDVSYDRGTDGPPGCGSMTSIVGQGEFAVEVPVPCDRSYMDKGDPPPEVNSGEEVVNPDPTDLPEASGSPMM